MSIFCLLCNERTCLNCIFIQLICEFFCQQLQHNYNDPNIKSSFTGFSSYVLIFYYLPFKRFNLFVALKHGLLSYQSLKMANKWQNKALYKLTIYPGAWPRIPLNFGFSTQLASVFAI